MKPALPPPFVRAFLAKVRRRRSALLLLRLAGILISGFGSLVLLRGLLDSLLEFPRALRILLLTLDALGAAAAAWWWGWRPWRELRGDRATALLAERLDPRLRSALISSVQLENRTEAAAFRPMLHRVTRRALADFDLRSAIASRWARRWVLAAVATLALTLALGLAFPEPTRIVLLRHLGFDVSRPSRTRVIPVSENLEVVLGQRVVLAARAEGVIPRGGTVRVRPEGKAEQVIEVKASAKDLNLFEFPLENVQASFTYQFVLNDGTGPMFSVVAAAPPRVTRLELRVTPPAYTHRLPELLTEPPFPLLAGSRVEVSGEASEPITSAALQPVPEAKAAALEVDGSTFAGGWTVPAESVDAFTIPLMNRKGVPSYPDRLYAIRHLVDRPPTIEVVQPEILAESLVAGEPVDFIVFARDDFPMDPPTLNFRVEPPEGEAAEGALTLPATTAEAPTAARWQPAQGAVAPAPGDRVTVWIEVRDAVGQSARTPEWTFRVVTREQKRAELTEQLRAQSLEIQRLREAQEAAQEQTRRKLESPD